MPPWGDTVSGMNTTSLIAQWSMEGARRDLAGRFRSSVDILAAVSARTSKLERTPAPPSVDLTPLFLKQADGEDWQPLVAGA